MVRYAVRDLHGLLVWIDRTVAYTYRQERKRQGEHALLSQGERETVSRQMNCVKKHFIELQLLDSSPAIDELTASLEIMQLGELRGHLLGIRRILVDALDKRVFMYIPEELSSYAEPFREITGGIPLGAGERFTWVSPPRDPAVKPFGDVVFNVFDKARYDSEQVALCIVAGASTAAVFHMMRVVEWGMRALGKNLAMQMVKDQTRTGIKLTPIENLTWEKLHNQLRSKADKRIAKLRPGPAKDKRQGFYSSIFHDFHGFREAWRNHVMHTRAEVDEAEAMRVLGHVHRFMTELASAQ
jgi:hypothetical protein